MIVDRFGKYLRNQATLDLHEWNGKETINTHNTQRQGAHMDTRPDNHQGETGLVGEPNSPERRKEMSPYRMPEIGKTVQAKITKIERQQAKDVFTNKAGEFVGEYSDPEDVVFTFHGIIEGRKDEIKLGTLNAPKNPAGQLFGTSKLFQLIQKMGIDPPLTQLSDDLRELKGRTVPCTYDAKGFVNMAI